MDDKFYVSYEAARLLKEKGYNEECDCAIDEDRDIHVCEYRMNQDLPEWKWSCPTKSEAIDWLESNGILVEILREYRGIWYFYIYKGKNLPYLSSSIYKTRLEAEEAAIIKACELL